MSEMLLNSVAKHVLLSDEEQQLLLTFFTNKSLKKKEYLIREGESGKGTAFVTEGILRSYSLDKDGFEHVIQFAPPGWWMGDIFSNNYQKPARLFIDALVENTEYLWIGRKDWESMFKAIPKMERFFRILSENALISHQTRLINFLSLTAKERYTSFCEQYPSLINCLPQKQVASYIGVTPEFLSKMLKEQFS